MMQLWPFSSSVDAPADDELCQRLDQIEAEQAQLRHQLEHDRARHIPEGFREYRERKESHVYSRRILEPVR